MERMARSLAGRIKRNPAVSAERKLALGLSITPPGPGPRLPRPSSAPQVWVEGTTGRRLNLRLRDAERGHGRARPRGVRGALVFLHVGEEAPASRDAWRYVGMRNNTLSDVEVPAGVAPGQKVWLCTQWINPTGQAGPTSQPVYARAPFGIEMRRNVA
jgi:hypothetical protein